MPCACVALIVAFAPLCSKPVCQHVPVLLVGAILAPGPRPVPPALRGMGPHQDPPFPHAPRVLNRAVWSRRTAAQIRLGLWRNAFARSGPLVLGLDDPIARRRGAQRAAKGMDRAPVRAAPAHGVKARG